MCDELLAALSYKTFRVFRDPGRSGKTLKRPGIRELIASVRRGEIKVVAAYTLCRLSRNKKDLKFLIDELMAHGVRLITVLEDFDSEQDDRANLMAVAGHAVGWDVEHRAQRTKAAKDDLAERCIHIGGKAPYGYRVVKGMNTLRIDKVEAKAVRLIFRLKDKGKPWTIKTIAEELDARGYSAPKAARWKARTITKILGRKNKYRGIFKHKVETPDGKKKVFLHFEKSLAIIRDEKWKKLCRKYDGIRHEAGKEGCGGRCVEVG